MLFEQLVVDLGRATDHPPHEALSDREFRSYAPDCFRKDGRRDCRVALTEAIAPSALTARGSWKKWGMRTNAELTYYAIQSKLVG